MLKTVDIPNVEVLRVGSWNSVSHGRVAFSSEDLDEAVAVYEAIKDEFKPRLKIGHDAKQRVAKLLFGDDVDGDLDGFPALGWLDNLRRVGDRLVVDLRQVPVRLAEMIQGGAYRLRSPEVTLIPLVAEGYTVAGKEYAKVLTGLAVLGDDIPAVHGLADVAVSLRAAGFEDAILFQAEIGSEELSNRIRAAVRVHFGVEDDDARGHPWVRDTYPDLNEAIVEFDGKLWRFPFAVGDDHEVTLGDPAEVTVQYIPVELAEADEELAAAFSELEAAWKRIDTMIRNRTGAGTLRSRWKAFQVDLARVVKGTFKMSEGDSDMDLKVLNAKLGLDEDASEDDVLAKLDELTTSQDTGGDADGDTTNDEPDSGGDAEEPEDAVEDDPGDATVQLAQRVAELEAERAKEKILAAVDAVMADNGDGVIAPAAKPALIALAERVGPEKLADMAVGFARVNLGEVGSSEEQTPPAELSAAEQKVARSMGISEDDFRAQKASDAARTEAV